MHKSLEVVDSIEFINLQPSEISPKMTACQIKVLYIGQNRNRTSISKEVATKMAKTLRGCPIVGYYKEEKEDFEEHSKRLTIEGDEVKFECLTKPYGFVAPDAKVWFQKFEDEDEFGNIQEREYLVTEGYLWTSQFEECQDVINTGRPQSMELDGQTLKGHWAEDFNSHREFFIINDAEITKLCILGNDVEPCFEGSSITKANSTNYSLKLDDNFKETLYTMMQEFKFAMKGDNKVENETTQVNTTVEETVTTPVVEFTKQDYDELKEKYSLVSKEFEDLKAKHETLTSDYTKLKENFDAVSAEKEELTKFKNQIEDEKKEALIAEFYMLSDEDKKDVVEHKSEYSLEDIEAKLSVICRRKKVNFGLSNKEENQNKVEEKKEPITTFSIEDSDSGLPAWLQAVKKNRDTE